MAQKDINQGLKNDSNFDQFLKEDEKIQNYDKHIQDLTSHIQTNIESYCLKCKNKMIGDFAL